MVQNNVFLTKLVASFIILVFLNIISLSFFGCSDSEDKKSIGTEIEQRVIPPSDVEPLPLEDDWVYLSDEDVNELMKMKLPFRWLDTKDPDLLRKYTHADILQKFGDIPQVRIFIEFNRNTANGYTSQNLYRHILYYEATYSLWPDPANRRVLEETRREQMIQIIDGGDRIVGKPKVTVGLIRKNILEEFGDIPQVHTYIEVLEKFLLDESVTDEDYFAFLEAKFHLWPNDRNQTELGLIPNWLRDV